LPQKEIADPLLADVLITRSGIGQFAGPEFTRDRILVDRLRRDLPATAAAASLRAA